MKLWQLKKISTDEPLNDPQPLPENWGPIFGLSGIVNKLSDLSWLGKDFIDQGWFIVGDAPGPTREELEVKANETVKRLLTESDWSVLPDVPMTKGEREQWIEYRKALREIKLQAGYPANIIWPALPQ